MKILYAFLFVVLVFPALLLGQSTATDFNIKDCSGTDRHLFADLDAGKIIVMSMVHPCGSCVAPTKSAQTVANGFATSHPGRVQFYLVDDFGDNPCSSLLSWANQYSITGAVLISNSAVNQNQYGSPAMPKIVVVGGTDHKVWFVQDNGLTPANLGAAIGQALAATGLENQSTDFRMRLFPNPANQELELTWSQPNTGNVEYDLYNIHGSVVLHGQWNQIKAGRQEKSIQLESLQPGLYFITIRSGSLTSNLRFTIVR